MRRAVSPADGSEQGGAGLVVEGDDDAGGREVHAVHQQGASGEGKAGGHIRSWGRSRAKVLEPRALWPSPVWTEAWCLGGPAQLPSTGEDSRAGQHPA